MQWAAFIEHHARLHRSDHATPRDLPLIVGCAKEMCESLATIVLTIKGNPINSSDSYSQRIAAAHSAIGLHPGHQLAGDDATKKTVGALMNLAGNLDDLRNAMGTGHGRAELNRRSPPTITPRSP